MAINSLNQRIHAQAFRSVFVACLFYVNVWAIIHILRQLPSWLLRMDSWEIFGTVSYLLTAALIESSLLVLLIAFFAILIPSSILKGKFSAQGVMFATISTIGAVGLHYGGVNILAWGLNQFLFTGSLFILTAVGMFFLVARVQRVEIILNSLSQHLTGLSYVYLFIDILAVLIVIIRNV